MFEIDTDNRTEFWAWSLGLGISLVCGFIFNLLTLAAIAVALAFGLWIFGPAGSAGKEASRWVLGAGVIVFFAVPFAVIAAAFFGGMIDYLT